MYDFRLLVLYLFSYILFFKNFCYFLNFYHVNFWTLNWNIIVFISDFSQKGTL